MLLCLLVLSFFKFTFSLETPSQACNKVHLPKNVGELKILSVFSNAEENYTSPYLQGIAPTEVTSINFCNVTVTLTHPGDDDVVIISVWLPLQSWNGKSLATGGGGLLAGEFEVEQAPGVALGYVSAATDAGLSNNGTIGASSGLWVLNNDGSLNSGLLTNFAYRSIHDMNVIAKLVLRTFCGHAEQYSYYYGCSTGGRQGYLSATHYPTDVNGILAISPAINTPQVSLADFWPSVVMGNEVALPQCVFSAYQDAIIEYCDGLDGVLDGLVSMYNPDSCTFDPSSLVGQSIVCSDINSSITITSEDANAVRKIHQGPTSQDGKSLWYGVPPGASFSGLASTTVVNGSLVIEPFQAAEYWIQNFVFQDPNYPALNMTYQDFRTAFDLSVEKFSAQFGTLQPKLDEFRRGGKLLTWHGLADQYIAHSGTVTYWNATTASMGGAEKINPFYRLFLAPGAAHCGGGSGPVPVNPLAALTAWVENDTAPETLFASTTNAAGQTVSRDLCLYPSQLAYSGMGDVNQASSFNCR